MISNPYLQQLGTRYGIAIFTYYVQLSYRGQRRFLAHRHRPLLDRVLFPVWMVVSGRVKKTYEYDFASKGG